MAKALEIRKENISIKDQKRFWSRVSFGRFEDCWEWLGSRDHHGYGVIRFGGRQFRANRVAVALSHGIIAEGMGALHRCDNTFCVNPVAHLFEGTPADNHHDARKKRRTAYSGRQTEAVWETEPAYEVVHTWLLSEGIARTRREISQALGKEKKWTSGNLKILCAAGLVKMIETGSAPQYEATVPHGEPADWYGVCRNQTSKLVGPDNIVLDLLSEMGGFYTVKEMAKLTGLPGPSVNGTLAALVQQGKVRGYHSVPERRFAATIFNSIAA